MLGTILKRHWYDPAAAAIWSDESTLQRWFDVEVALAQAQAELGLIPVAAAQAISSRADARRVDMDRLAREIAFTLHPFVPALRQFEEICGEEAAAHLHWGATTQNIFDTATALQIRESQTMLMVWLRSAIDRLGTLAARHRTTLQAGRTHGQHALPVSFGLKLAAWRAELRRHVERLRGMEQRVLIARMGGAAGTFAAMAGRGREVQRRVAARLGLFDGGLPLRSSGDHFAEYVVALSLLAGTVEKISVNVTLLQRTEIAEAAEGFHSGKIGSSTMAQKRNPSRAMIVTGLARLLRLRAPGALDSMVQLDEADGAATNVADSVVPEAAILAVSMLAHLDVLLAALEVDPEAMRSNLERSRGLMMAESVMMHLAPAIGRHTAHRALYDLSMSAVARGETLAQALRGEPALASRIDVEAALDPASYLGEAPDCVDDETGQPPG